MNGKISVFHSIQWDLSVRDFGVIEQEFYVPKKYGSTFAFLDEFTLLQEPNILFEFPEFPYIEDLNCSTIL